MDTVMILILIFAFSPVIALLLLFCYLIKHRKDDKENSIRRRIEWEREEIEKEKLRILESLTKRTDKIFHVEFDKINEQGTQDEIVRIVNLLASKTAEICVKQSSDLASDYYDDAASNSKREWSKARNLAIEICPELEARMPHFGDLEPLKSYNAEHLIQATK